MTMPVYVYPSYTTAVARLGVTVLCALQRRSRAEVLASLSVRDLELYLDKARVRG